MGNFRDTILGTEGYLSNDEEFIVFLFKYYYLMTRLTNDDQSRSEIAATRNDRGNALTYQILKMSFCRIR